MTNEQPHLGQVRNRNLKAYMAFTSGTESPPIFDTWAALSAASACLGRRCWFQMGAIRIMPNQYVMLVGAPGVRKSSCISMTRGMLKQINALRFAPNNTAGRPQGLITAMKGEEKSAQSDDVDEAAAEMLRSMDVAALMDDEPEGNVLDRHALYVCEGELASFIGVKSTEFITFLTDMWDKSGEDQYEYTLKGGSVKIELPCLNMIGAITPMHITSYLPPEAIGQGFMSRVIMVYADERKTIAWPEPFEESAKIAYKAMFEKIATQFNGAFEYTPEAKALIIKLHEQGYGKIEDARFIHYQQRRQAHMIKVAMALASMRGEMLVNEDDIHDSDLILTITEARMSDSIGEYGMSPIALARSRIMDLLRDSREPMTSIRLSMAAGSDIRMPDLQRALYELTEQGVIVDVTVRDNNGLTRTAYVVPRSLYANAISKGATIDVSYALEDKAVRPQRSTASREAINTFATSGGQAEAEEELRASAAKPKAKTKEDVGALDIVGMISGLADKQRRGMH